MSIITISHEAFGDGRQIAERVASILNYRCISREVLVKASERYGIAEAKLIEVLEERPHHWWTNFWKAAGITVSRSRQRYVNWRRKDVLFITVVLVGNF